MSIKITKENIKQSNTDIFGNWVNNNIILITFIPPPVEPAHAPIKLAVIKVDMINDGHKL